MSDTERFNLIEHYQWKVMFVGNGCHIVLHRANAYAFAKTLREAIDMALEAQMKWSLDK